MAPSKTAEREARAARDRLRRYNARQGVHKHKTRRRRRDNIVAVIGGVVVVTLAALSQVFYFTTGPGTPEPTPSATQSAPPVAEESNVGNVPDPALAEARDWTGELVLNDVTLGLSLNGKVAPQAVASFVQDVTEEYYTGKTCHRLTDNGFFVLQCGSLDGAGTSDPAYRFGPIENAPADDVYPTGTIAMARAGNDARSNGHQFFIVYDTTTISSDSAGGYTVIGSVTSGLDQLVDKIISGGVADGLHDGAPMIPTTITGVRIQ